MANRLAHESSPYLRQHAGNPVDWYPWGPEALQRARDEDRPILLSVGYSSCHWCHVMERESFEDDATAELMNRHFVNVKVDREERPDVDQIYMKAVQAMTGRGGWPMTVFLKPDGAPFFGGTYYPPEPRHGMPSFRQVLRSVAEAWEERRDRVESGSARLLEALERTSTAGEARKVGIPMVERAYRTLASRYDPVHGGFGGAPKFPQPVTLELVLRHHLRTGEAQALEMVVHTLRRMAAGGMRDHLAGGFHRYSVDARWLVPHFEKMLYDNALLARAYVDAFRITGAEDLRVVAEETLDYLVADMRHPQGGFFSARDADSEGEEGLFYVWTPEEVGGVLGPEDAELFGRAYDVTPSGNFEGRSILHLPRGLHEVAAADGMDEEELRGRLAEARRALLDARSRREPPFRDEKVLTAWNGLAVRAFAEAGATLGREDLVEVARGTAGFLWSELRADGRLRRTWKDGEAKIHAFLEDHGALGNAYVSLHEATLEAEWLERAVWLADEILLRFHDEDAGLFFDAPDDAEALVVRPRDPTDSATPSGPSLAAELFARLGSVTGDRRYADTARAIVDREADMLEQAGPAFGRMLSVVDRLEADPVEIAIVGDDDAATDALLRATHAEPLRNVVVVGHREGDAGPPAALSSPLLEGRGRVDGRAAAYVCRNYACGLPATTPDELAERLRSLDRAVQG